MKAIAIIMIIAVSVASNYQKSVSQCHMMNMNHSEHSAQANAAVPAEAPAVTADSSKTMYTCSMHPEIELDKPGNCPKCGMKLVKQSAAANDSKLQKDSVYYGCCPGCPEIKMDKPGKCPKCGMELVKKTAKISDTKSEMKKTEHEHKEGEGHPH